MEKLDEGFSGNDQLKANAVQIFKTKGVTSFRNGMSDTPDMPRGELLIYTSPTGNVRVEVAYQDESFWLTQKKIADLFAVDVRTINEHLRNIFKTRELDEGAVIRKFRTTAADGKSYLTNVYNSIRTTC